MMNSRCASFKSCWLGKWFDLQQTHTYEKLHSDIRLGFGIRSQNECETYKGMKSVIYILITLTLRGNATYFGERCNNSFSSLFGFSEELRQRCRQCRRRCAASKRTLESDDNSFA